MAPGYCTLVHIQVAPWTLPENGPYIPGRERQKVQAQREGQAFPGQVDHAGQKKGGYRDRPEIVLGS